MLPYMSQKINKKAVQITKFGGVNYSESKSDNELVSSVNMSARNYPCLSSEKGAYTKITSDENINGMGFYNKLFYTASAESNNECNLYYGDSHALISDADNNSERYFACMSDQVLVMPDKALYTPSSNTAKKLAYSQCFDMDTACEEAIKHIGGVYTTPKGVAVITSDSIQSTAIEYNVYSWLCMRPKDIKEGEFIHISADVYVSNVSDYEKYNEYKQKMKEGFMLQIKSISTVDNKNIYGSELVNNMLRFDENTIDTGGYDKVYATSITIEKKIPDLEHICTHGNRVWGVEGNTIRCSLLGDVSVWYDFSSDTYGTLPSSCYSLEVDTGGEFTAICVFNGNIFAFKENCVHKIYGSQPDDYTLYTQSLSGVQKGAHKTLVCINGILYYKGVDGFYAYSGGVPVCISEKTESDITAIAAATDGTNYYVAVQSGEKQKILVYCVDKKIWHEQACDGEFLMVSNGDKVYAASKNKILLLNEKSPDDTKWSFETEFDEGTFNNKCYTRLLLKYSLGKNGYFTVKTIFDDNTQLTHINGDYENSDDGCSIIVLPRIKCRKMRVKFEGKGDFTLKNITREYFLLNEGGR